MSWQMPISANATRQRGVLLRPIGNTVYLMPPYILDNDTTARLAQQTLAALDDTLEHH